MQASWLPISHSPGVQAMPKGVIDTWGTYSIVVIPPMFTYGLRTPSILPAFKRAGDSGVNLFT